MSSKGGGGYSEIFTLLRLGLFFWVQILNFNIFGGFQKIFFWGV